MFKELPNTWGSDSLTAHIDGAIDNIAATVAKNSAEYSSLNKVDSCYNSIVGGLINPPGFLEGLFLMRAHVAFRASCMLAMSGHSPETFPVLRSCLENALYALHINQNKGLDDLWLRRHDNPSMEKKVRAEFSYRNVIKTLETVDAENHKVAVSLYQRAIDYGAHPNERAMISSMGLKQEDGRSHYMQDYLSGGTMSHRHSLKSCAQIGLCSLIIFQRIFSERFSILGISDRIMALKKVL